MELGRTGLAQGMSMKVSGSVPTIMVCVRHQLLVGHKIQLLADADESESAIDGSEVNNVQG